MAEHRPALANPGPLNRQERLLIIGTLLVLAAGCLVVAAPLGLGLAIRRGRVAGPNVDVRLGTLRVVAVTNRYPDCNPRLEGCQADFLHPRAGLPSYYTVWVVTHRQVSGPNGVQDRFGSQRLLKIQAGP